MGKNPCPADFTFEKIYELFVFVNKQNLQLDIIKYILPVIYKYPRKELHNVLTDIGYKRYGREKILSQIPLLKREYQKIGISKGPEAEWRWIMKKILKFALGNTDLARLSEIIREGGARA